jgi:anti-sigma B factor antagonist
VTVQRDVVVAMPAELDVAGVDQASQELHEAVSSGAAVVIVDLTQTAYCDSSAISVMIGTIREAEAARVQVRFAIPASGAVMRIIKVTGVDKLMAIYPTVALAQAANSDAGS